MRSHYLHIVFLGGTLLASSTALAADGLAARPYGNTMGDGLRLSTEPPAPLHAQTCADGDTLPGIDISYYQGTVDWNALAADGVVFAFVRVSHSLQFEDPEFDNNWNGARAAGITTGVYQYFEPDEDPVAQAQLLLDRMGPLAPGDLPPVIDVESAAGQTPAAIASAVAAWLDHVESSLGVTPIIYTGKYFWQDNVGSDEFADYPLWVAHYTDGCPNLPDQWTEWTFHQYCDCGSEGGISPLDVNRFNGDLAQLEAFAGGAGAECGDGACSGGESPFSCAEDCPPCGVIGVDGGTIDNGDACYELHGPPEYWREEAAGAGGSLVWTHATDFPDPSNYAVWPLFFANPGEYRVEVHVPAPWGESTQAQYVVSHVGGAEAVGVNQSQQDGWVDLGTFEFDAATDHFVRLDDNTGEPNDASIQLVLDALRIVPVDVDGESGGSGDPPVTSGDPGDGSGGVDSGPDEGTSGASASASDSDDDAGGTGLGSSALPSGSTDTTPGCSCGVGGSAFAWWLPMAIAFRRRRTIRTAARAA